MISWCSEKLAVVGRTTLQGIQRIGHYTLFALEAMSHVVRPPFYGRQWLQALFEVGYASLPVVGLTAFFSGMVLALQSYTGFSRFSAEGSIATVVVLSMTRELGPVIGGLMVTGRVASAAAAEMGSMRVTEQMDALMVLGVHPMKYLVTPRLVAGIITLPLLVLLADCIGVYGGYVVGLYRLHLNEGYYLNQTFEYLKTIDVVSGLVKAAVFGVVMTITGSFAGFYAHQGAQGVGRATTQAVVVSSILILLFNYVLTFAFFDR